MTLSLMVAATQLSWGAAEKEVSPRAPSESTREGDRSKEAFDSEAKLEKEKFHEASNSELKAVEYTCADCDSCPCSWIEKLFNPDPCAVCTTFCAASCS